MSGVVCGAVVPHAPLLLPEAVGDQVAGETDALRQAVASLSFDEVSVIVVLSPHADSTGVYGAIEGSLSDFSIEGVELNRPSDRTAVDGVSNLWGKPVRAGPVDHGVLVPLKLLADIDKPVIAAGIRDTGSSGSPIDAPDAIAEGISFARALLQFAQDKRVAFVASAHTSSALLPRAPLTERAEAKPTEAAVLDALRSDPAHLESWLMDLGIRGGSCSLATWAAYGQVFGGRSSELLAYEYPFGVGYVVARVG